MTAIRTPREVYDFWFVRCGRDLWFRATPELDVEIRDVFRDTHLALAAGVGDEWRADPVSRLAAVIVLDQFPRNIYRGTGLAVATDGLALREAKLALAAGADQAVELACRTFFYLPFEHAENLDEQERSVALFTALGDEEYLDYAVRHRDVIAAYGRFPHRNAMLGRESTAAELDYLSKPGAGF
ncbi:DUF924 family protein [Rhizobium bangladeshense]|uniref:DUF924 family protein n=1 Tax=Rhizobium bangladeshense TaxID=1138189 RepID=UPI0007E53065|nr:DUF924 family protein [Rhizobium bangladeshense]MBX4930703.1 DUF924 domain-containing protein [Rhizobium bangladeshense]MBY3580994.1 DUF924 domain-containing protein [Rhizobium bangladeshense]MBY3598739.1 DUF924 domain-containing protein [Rhizobium bangladeshense]QSY87084.1 DUF924 domain-containing protein [Rhizobium bangladeshense]